MGKRGSLFSSVLRSRRESGGNEVEVRRVEEKLRSSAQATEQWLNLLREMEMSGETADARYERYYQAYLQARQQQKRVDLELFNLRQGLTS